MYAIRSYYDRIIGVAPDRAILDLRGVSAALADANYGARLPGELPAQPWTAAPEINRFS